MTRAEWEHQARELLKRAVQVCIAPNLADEIRALLRETPSDEDDAHVPDCVCQECHDKRKPQPRKRKASK